ncbi:MAG: helix-turn-helix transcriptional regulator [Nocardioidaceae bacterium]|nr:helix-turn-helix transcriptional regulator [Nocardioidaceae bacterium]
MILVRRLLGAVLRQQRLLQGRTLRDVSAAAQVSLGYISEIERGQKEASSECLAAICSALDVPLSTVLAEVSDEIAREEAMLVGLTPLPRVTRVSADVGVAA